MYVQLGSVDLINTKFFWGKKIPQPAWMRKKVSIGRCDVCQVCHHVTVNHCHLYNAFNWIRLGSKRKAVRFDIKSYYVLKGTGRNLKWAWKFACFFNFWRVSCWCCGSCCLFYVYLFGHDVRTNEGCSG